MKALMILGFQGKNIKSLKKSSCHLFQKFTKQNKSLLLEMIVIKK